jgi:hypothetical protein
MPSPAFNKMHSGKDDVELPPVRQKIRRTILPKYRTQNIAEFQAARLYHRRRKLQCARQQCTSESHQSKIKPRLTRMNEPLASIVATIEVLRDIHKICGKPCEYRFFDRLNCMKINTFSPVCLKVVQ